MSAATFATTAGDVTTRVWRPDLHRPVLVRVSAHCRVDCSCGWKGPKVALSGHGHEPWVTHFKEGADRG